MGKFKITISKGVHHVSTEVDDLYADDDKVLAETVRHLISEMARRHTDISDRWYPR